MSDSGKQQDETAALDRREHGLGPDPEGDDLLFAFTGPEGEDAEDEEALLLVEDEDGDLLTAATGTTDDQTAEEAAMHVVDTP